MENDTWAGALDGSSAQITDVINACYVCIGSVHRLFTGGDDPHQDRRQALKALLALLTSLRVELPPVAAVLDWWLVAALGERKEAETAWQIKRLLPGATGEALERVLALKVERPLQVLRYPSRLKEILQRLKDLTNQHGKLNSDGRIFAQANQECLAVIHAAQAGAPPPTDLRLSGLSEDDAMAWASEQEEGRGLIVNSSIWLFVVRSLTERAALIEEAIRVWPDKHMAIPGLPREWEREIREATAPHHELALALVADLSPAPPPRPLLAAAPERFAAAPARAKWSVYRLAREAHHAAEKAPAPWMDACARELEALSAQIDALYAQAQGAPSALGYVEEAERALKEGDVDSAREWVEAAREGIVKSSQEMATERRQAQLTAQRADLEAVGLSLPALTSSLDQDEQRLQAALIEIADTLLQYAEELSQQLALFQRRATPDADIAAARAALQRRQIRVAYAALLRAAARVNDARDADDARLGDLVSLRDQISPRADRAALFDLLDLAAHRRDAMLDPAPALLDLAALLALTAPASLASLARSAPDPGAWGRVIDPEAPLPPEDQARLYLLRDGCVFGPCVVREGRCAPEHPWIAVASVPAPLFFAVAGRVEAGASEPGGTRVPYPLSLEEMRSIGAELHDASTDEELAGWLADEVGGAAALERLWRWLRATPADDLPPELYAHRVGKLQALLPRAERLASLRAEAIQAYLASDEGQADLAAAIQAAAEASEERIRAEIEARRAALSAGIDQLEADRAALEADHARAQAEAQAKLSAIQAEIADADALLEDRRLALLARFLGAQAQPGVLNVTAPAPHGPPVATAPLRATAATYQTPPPLSEIVSMVADKTWEVQDVANLLLSVLTGRWTLLAGMPGVGKSTFVRSVLSRVGHGPGSGRYLELVVRRDWQDDTPLFGFWHPTHHAWEPSSEGFVEHLLRAADDHASKYGGLYPVLIEELNLASPEYYLARPISALEAAQPLVRLYDPSLSPANAARYPASFSIPDAVRLLATVNVDDTVERLSPRFLSRASVLRVEPGRGLSWRPEDDAPRISLSWQAMGEIVAGPPGELGAIDRLIRFLTHQRVPGGPTARTCVAMGRYLGAARGVLDRKQAEDLLILQRILPPLRGVGPQWRKLLDDLHALLTEQKWTLSADRTRDLRERGEALGDWYDFFHT